MKKIISAFFVTLLFAGIASSTYGQRVIKIASMVPENTAWGRALNQMKAEWTQATNGEVLFEIYHNGTAGNELDVLRKLKLNHIQAAVFTSVGMSAISQEIMTLSVPFMIRTDDELKVILDSAKDDLEKLLSNKGFQVMAWARAGWVKFFSKNPVATPQDVKRIKLGTIAGQEELTQAFKAMGYQLIPMDVTELLITINSVDAIYQSPLMVAVNQIFTTTKHMVNLNVAPIMGGLLMNQPAWRAIPAKYRPKILEIAKRVESEMDRSILSLEQDAVNTMQNHGLSVHELTREQIQVWYDDTAKAIPGLLGSTYNRDLYNRFTAILEEYRRR